MQIERLDFYGKFAKEKVARLTKGAKIYKNSWRKAK